jgi:beta-N-acetylhexosaminidase
MSLREFRRHAGRLAIVGFSGTSVPDDLRRLVAEFDVGGVIYFARNIVEPRQVAELSREVASLTRDWPLWISVDQEGGRVARLKRPFTEWPPMVTLGRSGDEKLVERFARALAAELRAVGINLDYAPVLDIWTNPRNQVIGDRALANHAEAVARLGEVIVRTLQEAGVAGCGKHFPGHGDTVADSHDELPFVEAPPDRLEAVELMPFKAAIEAGVATMMMAHVLVPSVDDARPASLSRTFVEDWLKGKLGFGGVVICDDLGMKAVATRPLGEISVDALAAGNDVLLMCNSTTEDQIVAMEAIVRAAEAGQLRSTRIDDAWKRQKAVKERFLGNHVPVRKTSLDVIGATEHQIVAEEMAAWR